MREILFRGKRIDNGEWIEGCLLNVTLGGKTARLIFGDNFIRAKNDVKALSHAMVDPETVGQFTGLTDKNGKKIFEGDIVTAKDEIWGSPFCYSITGKIVYDEASFFIEPKDVMETQYIFNECAVYEVIGNIHDNPELLENP